VDSGGLDTEARVPVPGRFALDRDFLDFGAFGEISVEDDGTSPIFESHSLDRPLVFLSLKPDWL
jgi:hypothetical protein